MDLARVYCPVCRRWVPTTLMNIDVDEDGVVHRICTPCIEGTVERFNFVYDPHPLTVKQLVEHEQCVYCDSYNTTNISGNKWQCNNCGEEFYI